MSTEEVMSRADIIKELTEHIRTFGFNSISRLKKHEALRRLNAIKKFKEFYDAEAEIGKMKPGPLGTRKIPFETIVLEGEAVKAPAVPRKCKTFDRSKPTRYIATMVENGGVVSFKD